MNLSPERAPFERVMLGQMMPEFSLRSTENRRVRSRDYHGYRLILAFVGGANDRVGRRVLRQLQAIQLPLHALDTRVLIIAPLEVDLNRFESPGQFRSFPVLKDVNAEVHRQYGAVDWSDQPAPSIFITDANGRVIYRALGGFHQALPSSAEIIAFLEYDLLRPTSTPVFVPERTA